MTTKCDYCGAEIERKEPRQHNFCCRDHMNKWNREHCDYSAMSKGHKAEHLTALNRATNALAKMPHSDTKHGNSAKARRILAEYLGRPLTAEEEVHHINGDESDNRIENLVAMKRSDHRRYHRLKALFEYDWRKKHEQ